MRTLGRILLGAVVGLAVAVAISIVIIIVYEYLIAEQWVDAYDDATMALLLQILLMSAPIIGGWWAWTRGEVSRDAS